MSSPLQQQMSRAPRPGQQSAGGQQPPTPPAPQPYEPTPEEEAYLQVCGQAITSGCTAAVEAASAGDAGKYLEYANGVKSLTAAYVEIKTGGKAATGHQGS